MTIGNTLRLPWRILKTTARKITQDNDLFLASGLAFELLVYFIPLSLLAVSVLGFILAGSGEAMAGLKEMLGRFLPVPEEIIEQNISAFVQKRGLLGIAGIVVLLIWGSAAMTSARTVLNIIMGVQDPRGFFRGRALDLSLLLGVAGILVMGVSAGSLVALVVTVASHIPYLSGLVASGWRLFNPFFGFFLTFVLFLILYHYLPARRLSRTSVLIASGIGAGLFEFSKWLFAWYVSVAETYTFIYGALSGMIFFVLWLYYASLVFILSATLGWSVDHERGLAAGEAARRNPSVDPAP